MPKKTIVAAGTLLSAAAAVWISSASAYAQILTDGDGSHSRSHSLQRHHNRNWNGSDNQDYNRTRLRVHNRNNDIAVARTRPANRAAAARCIDSAVQGNTKFVAVTRNGQIFVQEVTLTPNPTPSFWQNTTTVFTNPFPGFTPSCVTVTVMGNNLHVSVLGADGRVLQAACTVNPPPTEFPASCGTPIDLGVPSSALQASTARRATGTAPFSAFRRSSGRGIPRSASAVRAARTHRP